MCFGCSKEPSHRDGSFEYPQHMFWLRNKKNYFPLRTLIRGPVPGEEFIPDIFFTSCMENNVDPDLYLQYFRKRICTGSATAGYKHQLN